jgi:hypothetical protein
LPKALSRRGLFLARRSRFLALYQGTASEAAEKRFSVRSASLRAGLAAARNCCFASTYGTAKAGPFRKIMLKPSFSALFSRAIQPREIIGL